MFTPDSSKACNYFNIINLFEQTHTQALMVEQTQTHDVHAMEYLCADYFAAESRLTYLPFGSRHIKPILTKFIPQNKNTIP